MMKYITQGFLVLSIAFTVLFAGATPAKLNNVDLVIIKSIDLIFANGFEPESAAQLDSETPFTGSLPVLEPGYDEVGAITGSFSVDQTGQTNYEIPIFAGTGTAGVAPQISLKYSSAGGNGHVGVGWSISGITVISRCRETEESKSSTGSLTPSPITFGGEDRFCLNGETMMVSNQGHYGDDGTEYRTEKDQFARIISYDTTNGDNNPDYFTIERKDGSISYYGNTTNSNITILSADNTIDGKTYTWVLNRYQDTMSNYIDYDYNKLNHGEFVISDIDFTGNDDEALLPYNNIHFTYEARPDSNTSYLGGVQFDTTRRLAMIESSIDGTVVRDYTLSYQISTTSSNSLLSSVMECANNKCFEPTTFTWSQPNRQFKSQGSGNTAFPKDIKSSKMGDVNGDGRADLVFVDDSQNIFKVAFANGHSGFGVSTATGVIAPSGSEIDDKWQLIDFNADGRQDLLKQSGSIWVVHLATASSFEVTTTPTGISSVSNSDFQIVDINGDGLADILYPNSNEQLQVKYLERSGSSYQFSSQTYPVSLPSHPNQIPGISYTQQPGYIHQLEYRYHDEDTINIHASDINGDGIADLILRTDLYETAPPFNTINDDAPYQFISAGDESNNTTGEPQPEHVSSQWVAFIGRGLDGNNYLNYRSNHYIKASTLNHSDDKFFRFVDINADGLTDVLNRDSVNNWEFKLATGNGFTDYEAITSISNDEDLQLVDVNLDGFMDLLYPTNVPGKSYYYRSWTGTGFSTSAFFSGAKAEDLNQNVNLFLDFDGDGAVDHLRIDSGGIQRLYPREDNYLPADKITAFTNGLGAKTEILYRPLTFAKTYQQGDHGTTALNWGNGSPVLDVMGAIYVAREVSEDAPIEGDPNHQNTVRYRYENARVQTGGRGFLGFEKVITETPVQSATDTKAKILETTTTYRQDFPYNGIPAMTVIKQLDVDFDSPQYTPPACTVDDTCFEPCYPGEVCFDPQRGSGSSDIILSERINTPNKSNPTNKSTFPYIETSETKTYDPDNGNLLKSVTQTSTHDNYGNPESTIQTIKDGTGTVLQTNTTANVYSNFTGSGKWLIGLLESSTTTKTRSGQSSITTTTEFDYDTTTGLLVEERQEPNGGPELFLRKRYHYDDYGNTNKVISCSGSSLNSTQCDNNTPASSDTLTPYLIHRYERTVFDPKGRYVKETYNTEDQKLSEVLTRDIYGNPLTSQNLLNQTTTNNYDAFGRLVSTRNSLGKWTQTSRQWCEDLSGDLACPAGMNLSIRVRKKEAGGLTSYVYMDLLGREVATISRSFNAVNNGTTSGDDRYVLNRIWHDPLGRKVKSEDNHFLGANAANIPITTTQYDRYNRSTRFILPDGAEEHMSYAGLTTNFTNDSGQRRQETKNALDQLIEVKDFDVSGTSPNFKNTLTYQYDSQGALEEVKRTADSVTELLIKNSYDQKGRKISSNDVDSGFSEIFYNALGEVVETIDSENNHIYTYYDTLGRSYRVESWAGTTQLTRNTNTYNATNGLLGNESKLTFDGNISYTQNHVYDALKRPVTTNITLTDVDNVCAGATCTYQANLYYDQFSRLKYQQDVSGKSIENHYNAQGYLSHVTDTSDSTNEYYRINKTDKWGNVVSDTKGGNVVDLTATYSFHNKRGWLSSVTSAHQNNVYEYDKLGNLIKRADILYDQSECFFYDRLNRLTDTYRFNSFGQNCSNTSGNVEHQDIDYDAKGNIELKDGFSYNYLQGSATTIASSPHQVQSKGSQSFFYDNKGNLTESTNFRNANNQLVSRNLSYTGFNKIKRIYTGSDSNNPIDESVYRYNNSEKRYARVDTNDQNETTVTHFMGNVEVEYNANGQVAFKRHLGNYAIITETNASTQETYLFHDHLGSIDVITDKKGRVLQQMSFSAWGERRLPANWLDISQSTSRSFLSDYTTKGFTGHEMLDVFGIINMGGRIYDSELGKMLQADPVVQDPNTSQSFNRYSYVHNNPLSFTDPTGYFSLRQLAAAVVGVVLSFVLPGIGFNIFWAAFTVGFTSTYIITGNFRTALKAGIIAGAVAFAGSQFANKGGADAAKSGTKATTGGKGDTTTGTALAETAPTTTSASGLAGAFEGVSAFDVVSQVVQSLDPKAGAILNFIKGGNIDFSTAKATGGTFQNLISLYGKFKVTEELQRLAQKNGLSLVELNMALVTMSFVGNKLVGTRFYEDNFLGSTNDLRSGHQGIEGILSRNTNSGFIQNLSLNRTIGLFFDLVDIALGMQGLITASGYDAIKRGDSDRLIRGFSLGSMDANNLVARQYFDSGLSQSLVFGNIAHSNVNVEIGALDVVNGLFLGIFLNPSAKLMFNNNGCFLHEISGCY